MNSTKRPGPDFRGAFASIVRTAFDQATVVRDVAMQRTEAQRDWIDATLQARRRREALAALGEHVFELVQGGQAPELGSHPDIADAIERIIAVDIEAGDDDPGAPGAPAQWGKSKYRSGDRPPAVPDDVVDAEFFAPPTEAPQSSSPKGNAPPSSIPGIVFSEDNPSTDDDLGDYMHEDDV